MLPWLEAWLIERLLRTPGFHRLAERAVKGVNRVKSGNFQPEERGGTNIESPGASPAFAKHFVDEVKAQLGRAEARAPPSIAGREAPHAPGKEEETAHEAWENLRRRMQPGSHETRPQDPAKLEETAHEAWEKVRRTMREDGADTGKKGFFGEYISALQQQLRNEKRGG